MYAVIFKAKAKNLDSIQQQQYSQMADTLRALAFEKYACIDFISASAGEQEITISYWPDEQSIKRWKNDIQHTLAQQLGSQKWYDSYTVQVLEVKREYQSKGGN
jgi:hypothetical protein